MLYNVLLNGLWMHKNAEFLRHSTNGQCPPRGGEEITTTDNDPFSSIEAYHAEVQFYKMNGKGAANEKNGLKHSFQLDIRWQDLLDQ